MDDIIGKSVLRIDARDKVLGLAKYTEDLCPAYALVARVLHSTVANGYVKSINVEQARQTPGVTAVFTCMDVPDIQFPTAGHPWSVDPAHQDVADRRLLNRRVRYIGDDIAAVVAEDEITAAKALKTIKVEYEVYAPLLTMEASLAEGAEPIHEEFPGNILKQHSYYHGSMAAAVSEPGLVYLDKHYSTAKVSHCHLETAVSFAYEENGKIVVVSSTQIPHIMRRIIGQALGLPWGRVRVIKPMIGGGFGNKQDVLYEPLNAWLSLQLKGRCVKLALPREEVFESTRCRHAMDFRIRAWARPDGALVARDIKAYSDQGAYASHGHALVANAITNMRCMYRDGLAIAEQAFTVYTNSTTAGAMRAYGVPQAAFAMECLMDDLAVKLKLDPIAVREKNMMRPGFVDPVTGITCHSWGLGDCIAKGRAYMDWDRKRRQYAAQSGPLRRGVGMAIFTYKTGVYPISLETSNARMLLNQDGTMQLHLGATEIGQGADTVFCQMAAAASGLRFEDIRIVSTQDTDVAPYDSGAYASRQTYVTGKAIKLVGEKFREQILAHAEILLRRRMAVLDLKDSVVVDKHNGEQLMTLEELALNACYSLTESRHISAEGTSHCSDNTYSFGCTFAEVEVDMPLGRVRVLDIVNVHDSGVIINPALASAQVEGGMAMSIGAALSERLLYDRQGRMQNGNLLDYKLPTALDLPDLHADFAGQPDPTGPFGNKALGEPPIITPAPAIRNAVLNATGVGVDSLPLSPPKLVALFRERGLT